MDVAKLVRNGIRLISDRQIIRNGATQKSMKNGRKPMTAVKQPCARVQTLDCIGHVQKRIGTHLKALRKKEKLTDGKSVKGSKHRLTDKAIDKLQCYYGNAIRASIKPGKLTAEQQKDQMSTMQRL